MTRILFLDQSGKLGGAELCLADIAQPFSQSSLVGVFDEGPFPDYLRELGIPVQVLTTDAPDVKKASGLLTGLRSIKQLIPLIHSVAQLSRAYDVMYINTQKALVVGAIASMISRCPFVYHLHDIVSPEHFSSTNRRIIVTLANRARLIIANSQASRDAFIQAGGKADITHVVYNGFHPKNLTLGLTATDKSSLRSEFFPRTYSNKAPSDKTPSDKTDRDLFVVGHFSRLSPWKGQHILLEALSHCDDHVVGVFVGDALFGEQAYVQQLQNQIKTLQLENRVKFLGFRSDIPVLMSACDLIAHTSTTAEPFGRVIVEAMMCSVPVVATAAGGATELIDHEKTGWLTTPGNAEELATVISTCQAQPSKSEEMAQTAQIEATEKFDVQQINQQISGLLSKLALD